MGKTVPRSILSILAAGLVLLPVVLVLFASPAASQVNQTCGRLAQTDKTFPDLNVTAVVVKPLDPGMTVTKSGKWYFVSQPGDVLVEVTVKNVGTAATTDGDGAGDGSFVVTLEDLQPDGTTRTFDSKSVSGLAAGASSSALKFVAENYAQTGEHKLRATADATKKIAERCDEPAPSTQKVVRENNNILNQTLLLTAKPDLRITALTASSEVRAFSAASASSKIGFNATITNAGNHRAFNTESFSAGFLALFKLNGGEDACKKTSNTVNIKEILPGATKQVEVKCEVAGLTGDFNVSVDVDSGAKVVEANEANNRFTRVFHLRIADLAANVTGVTGTTEENAVPEFGSMTFTAVVRNGGDANASTDDDKKFEWFVYLDEKKDDAHMLSNFSTKLAPGASAQATFTIRPLERDLAPGEHKIFVVADSSRVGDTTKGKVIEGNETNNEFVLNFTVARFQLNLTAGSVSQKVSPGIDVEYPFNLTNEGNAKDEVEFTLEGAGVTARVELANGTEVTGTLDVPVNESVPLVLVVSIPKDAAENTTINVTVLAESTVPRASAADALTFRTNVGPDVVLPTIEKVKPTTNVIGQGGIIELRITDNVAVTRVTYALGGGATQTATAVSGSADTYRINPPTTDGPFQLTVTAFDAKNNQAREEFDLVVDTVDPEISDISVLQVEAREEGVDPNTPITVNAEISDANMKNATVRIGPIEAVMVRKAGAVWESVGLRAPASPGEYRIVIYAFDAGDNSAKAVEDLDRVRVKGVDLVLIQPTGARPTNPKEGDTVEITVPVGNAGLAEAVGVRVQLLIDGEVVDERIVNIPAGQQLAVDLTWEAEPGVHTYDIIVDPDNEFTETSELNNELFLGQDQSIATLFPQARLFTKEATENDFPDLLVRYLWVLLLGLAAIAVGAAAFFVKPA